MTPSPTADDLKVSAWLEIREPLERQLQPLGRVVMDALRLQPGERVIDIGCGIGGAPYDLARRVGPNGSVLGVDVLPAAIDVVRHDPDLPSNVDFICGDAQSHPFDAGAFDVAFSRFGVMFFADPVAAFANIHRALRPGGRLGFACWRSLDENELDHWPLRAAAPVLPPELVAETGNAGWFSLSDAAEIRTVLTRAGFVHVEVVAHDEAVGSGDLASMVAICSRVGALGAILRVHPQLRPAALPALEAALAARDGTSGPVLRAAIWVVFARAPG